MTLLRVTALELPYITYEAFVFIYVLHEAGIEDFDFAFELARKALGDEKVYALA